MIIRRSVRRVFRRFNRLVHAIVVRGARRAKVIETVSARHTTASKATHFGGGGGRTRGSNFQSVQVEHEANEDPETYQAYIG